MSVIRQVHTPEQKAFDGGEGWYKQMEFGRHWSPDKFPGDIPQRMHLTLRGQDFNFTPYAPFSCAYGEANVYSERAILELIDETNKYGKCFVFSAASKSIKDLVQKYKKNIEVLVEQESWMGNYDVWLCVTRTV